jgi:hypothetical protein
MLKTVLGLILAGALLGAAGCHTSSDTPKKPSAPVGTPPPSASNIPPPTPAGKTPGPGR